MGARRERHQGRLLGRLLSRVDKVGDTGVLDHDWNRLVRLGILDEVVKVALGVLCGGQYD